MEKQVATFDNLASQKDTVGGFEVRDAYNELYEGVVKHFYGKYESKNLSEFWAIGADYGGVSPGNNFLFWTVYSGLIERIRDGQIDKPVYRIEEIGGVWYDIEEAQNGEKTILGKISNV